MSDQPKATPLAVVKAYSRAPEIVERFQAILGEHEARPYIESVVLAVANSDSLQKCTPQSIMHSALRAATLRLSVDPAMRQAHLVPFKDTATLIVDYHGLVELMERTNLYRHINVIPVIDGEIVKQDRFTGVIEITGDAKPDGEVIGWCAFFEKMNGTQKYLYMTNEQCDAHGQKYSRAFNSQKSGWQTDRQAMRRKTVLRILANRWGTFSPGVSAVLKNEDDIIEAQAENMPDVPTPDMAIDGNSYERAQAIDAIETAGKTDEEKREIRTQRVEANLQQLGFN